jgi:hypothetical protein
MTSDKSHVLSGLIAKRAELAGRIETTQSELRRLMIDLDSLDATIRLFAPDIDLDEIRPKPLPARNHAFRGEMSRTVLNALRQARKPLPAYEIALLFMTSRGLATADRPLLRVIRKRVGACRATTAAKAWCAIAWDRGARCFGKSCAKQELADA